MTQIQKILTNNLSELETLAVTLDEFCTANSIPKEIFYEINLCLDELVTNIISYGYDDDIEHDILLKLEYDSGILKVELADDGKEFNPLNSAEPDINLEIENKPIGGLGIFFVKNKIDDIKYTRKNNQNILILKKKLDYTKGK